jgi:hypothetical protein
MSHRNAARVGTWGSPVRVRRLTAILTSYHRDPSVRSRCGPRGRKRSFSAGSRATGVATHCSSPPCAWNTKREYTMKRGRGLRAATYARKTMNRSPQDPADGPRRSSGFSYARIEETRQMATHKCRRWTSPYTDAALSGSRTPGSEDGVLGDAHSSRGRAWQRLNHTRHSYAAPRVPIGSQCGASGRRAATPTAESSAVALVDRTPTMPPDNRTVASSSRVLVCQ